MRLSLQATVVAALLFATKLADADVKAGVVGGVSVRKPDYFPTYFAGGKGTAERPLVGPVSLHADVRLQVYVHDEDEDYGSWGFRADVDAGFRVHLFAKEAHRTFNPFIEVHGGVAAVERIPFSSTASNELVAGYLLGGGLGADLSGAHPLSRIEVEFDVPSFFSTSDGSLSRGGVLSVGLAATLPW